MDHDWPGNVRELENAIERAVVLCPSDTVTTTHLPASLRGKSRMAEEESSGDLNLSAVEKRLLLGALGKTSWNQTRAAEVLGISRKQLRTKMKNHGLLTEE
jgi:DNA-binding NtrC family response regulator